MDAKHLLLRLLLNSMYDSSAPALSPISKKKQFQNPIPLTSDKFEQTFNVHCVLEETRESWQDPKDVSFAIIRV